MVVQLARDKKLIVASVLSFGAGAGSAYFFAKKKLETKYEQIAAQEIADAKRYYAALHKTDEFASPISAMEHYVEQVDGLQYRAIHPALEPVIDDGSAESADLIARGEELAEQLEAEEETSKLEEAEEVHNVFEGKTPVDDNFDLEDEMKRRNQYIPYVITHDEFYLGEKDYEQSTLTYYEGDDVLADERDQVINETETTVGNANLLRFGHGSKDNNVVYIRNERLALDFEIVRSNGAYAKEVLGFIEHSERRGRSRRHRSDDG